MNTNQQGFSVTVVLLIIVVLGLTGVVGWTVYDRQKSNSSKLSLINSSQDSTASESTGAEKASEEYIDYENKSLGIKFRFPKNWGSVTESPAFDTSRLLYVATFDKQTDISFVVPKNDYTTPESMGDPPCFQSGFGTFEFAEVLNNIQIYSEELVKSADMQVVESYKSGYCTGSKLEGRVKLNLSNSNGIHIVYYKQTEPQYLGSELITAEEYAKNYKINETLRADFIKVVLSVSTM